MRHFIISYHGIRPGGASAYGNCVCVADMYLCRAVISRQIMQNHGFDSVIPLSIAEVTEMEAKVWLQPATTDTTCDIPKEASL
jgi:hypothetical protein